MTINMAGASTTTTVHYHKKADSEKTEETDVESLSPTSKVTSPISKVAPSVERSSTTKGCSSPPLIPPPPSHPNPLRVPHSSPPRPSSPSSPVTVRPSARPAFSLDLPRGPTTSGPTHHLSPKRVVSPTEELAKVAHDQTRRIAEYDSGSLNDIHKELLLPASCSDGESQQAPNTTSLGSSPPFEFHSFPKVDVLAF